jgi:hypothetical protein
MPLGNHGLRSKGVTGGRERENRRRGEGELRFEKFGKKITRYIIFSNYAPAYQPFLFSCLLTYGAL